MSLAEPGSLVAGSLVTGSLVAGSGSRICFGLQSTPSLTSPLAGGVLCQAHFTAASGKEVKGGSAQGSCTAPLVSHRTACACIVFGLGLDTCKPIKMPQVLYSLLLRILPGAASLSLCVVDVNLKCVATTLCRSLNALELDLLRCRFGWEQRPCEATPEVVPEGAALGEGGAAGMAQPAGHTVLATIEQPAEVAKAAPAGGGEAVGAEPAAPVLGHVLAMAAHGAAAPPGTPPTAPLPPARAEAGAGAGTAEGAGNGLQKERSVKRSFTSEEDLWVVQQVMGGGAERGV